MADGYGYARSRKLPIGAIVELKAVDWGLLAEQTAPDNSALTIVRGKIYGQVIRCNREWVTIAPQVFEDGSVRNSVSVPWATVERVVIFQKESIDG